MQEGYKLETAMGMFVLGYVSLGFGLFVFFDTIYKGQIKVANGGRVIIRENIKAIFPLRFNYFWALVYTLSFGPGLIVIGILSLLQFFRAIVWIAF
jgi:hypothetical protein